MTMDENHKGESSPDPISPQGPPVQQNCQLANVSCAFGFFALLNLIGVPFFRKLDVGGAWTVMQKVSVGGAALTGLLAVVLGHVAYQCSRYRCSM